MAGELPFGLAPSGELTAYTPTLRERVSDWLRPMLFSDDRAGQEKANRLTNWAETMMPPFGFATQMYDTGRAGGEGNYAQVGLLGAMAMMPGKWNRREPLGHLMDAQPSGLQPSVQSIVSEPMPKLSRSDLEHLLSKYFPNFKKVDSASISDRHGPSASVYYQIETPDGIQTVRLSDHTYSQGNALDFRYGDDVDLAHFDLLKKFNLPADKETIDALRPKVMERYNRQLASYQQYIDSAIKDINNNTKKADRPAKIAEFVKKFPPPTNPLEGTP